MKLANRELQARRARQQRGVILWSVDIQGDERILDTHVLNMTLVLVLCVACDGCSWGAQKCFYHFAAGKVRVAVFAGILRDDRPNVIVGGFEAVQQNLNGCIASWRTVDQSDHGRVTAMVQYFAESNLQRTELTAGGIGIHNQRCAVSKNDWRQSPFILADHNDNEVGGTRKRANRGGEKRCGGRRLARRGRGAQAKRFISSPQRGSGG